MKILIIILFIQISQQQNPFIENNLEFYKDQSDPLIIIDNQQQQNYNNFAAQKNATKKIWYFQSTNFSLTNNFTFQIASFENDAIRNFQISIKDYNHIILNILISVDAQGQSSLSLVDCGKNNININADIQNIQCFNIQQENINIQVSQKIINIIDNQNLTIQQNPTQKNLQYLTSIQFNIEYIISILNRQQNYTKINWIEFTLTNPDVQDLYLTLQNFQYSIISCPPGCLNCSNNRECLKCDSVFLLTSGRCDCQGKLMTRFLYQQDVNLYIKSIVCNQILQDNDDFQEILVCENELQKRIKDNLINAQGKATFTQNQIKINFKYAANTSFQYIDDFCKDNLDVYNSLQIQDKNSELNVFYKLGNENDFELNKDYILTFPNFDWCDKEENAIKKLRIFTCSITTDYVLIKEPYNNLIQEIQNKYLLIQDTTSNSFVQKALLPLRQSNTNIQLTSDQLLNVLICSDNDCYYELSNQDYPKTDLLYINVIIEDPLFLYQKPKFESQLYINSELRNSLVQNVISVDDTLNNLVPEYIFVILLDSQELKGQTDFKLLINYLIDQQIKSLQTTFKLNIIDPYHSEGKKGFLNSLSFVVVLFTFGGIILLGIIGVFAHLIAKAIGRKPKSSKDYEKNNNSSNHRRFEMVPQQIQDSQKANKILSDLLN